MTGTRWRERKSETEGERGREGGGRKEGVGGRRGRDEEEGRRLGVFDLSYNIAIVKRLSRDYRRADDGGEKRAERKQKRGRARRAREWRRRRRRRSSVYRLEKDPCTARSMSSMILMLIQYERMNNGLLVKYVGT